MHSEFGGPKLLDLQPLQSIEDSPRRFVPLSRFHGSQKLNLMRATRLPANSRKYNYGDPVHLIDWRAFARTEQLIIKEQQDEASCNVCLVYQRSETMSWPTKEISSELTERHCSKQELAWRVILHLSYQAFRRGDKVKIYCSGKDGVQVISARSQVDIDLIFQSLDKSKFRDLPAGRICSIEQVMAEKSDYLYWISDGLDGFPTWLEASKKKFVCWLHTLSSLELSDTWMKGLDCYFDEQMDRKEFLGSILLTENSFANAVGKWQQSCKKNWTSMYGTYLLLTDSTPIQSYLLSLARVWNRTHLPYQGGFR